MSESNAKKPLLKLEDIHTGYGLIEVLHKLPEQVVRENWPYGVIL